MLNNTHIMRNINNFQVFCYCLQTSFILAGKARIRVQLSAAHSESDVERAVDAFIEIGRKLKVIS